MKRLSINHPIETDIVNKEEFYDGEYELQPLDSSTPYDATVVVPGSELSRVVPTYMTFKGKNDWLPIAGDHRRRVKPRSFVQSGFRFDDLGDIEEDDLSGVMPSSFSDPFDLKYSFGKRSEGGTLGQSNKGVVDYRRLKLSGDDDGSVMASIDNPRLHSHKGELLFLGEMVDPRDSSKQHVRLYRHNEQTDLFDLVRKFNDIPIDDVSVTTASDSTLQHGSPDMCTLGDELIVAYRYVERIDEEGVDDKNYIATWKTSDPDMVEWVNSSQEVTGSFGVDYDRPDSDSISNELHPIGSYGDHGFRLRVAAGADTLCLVYYGTKWDDSDKTQLRDMRTFVSYDRGLSLETNQSHYAQFSRIGSDYSYAESDRYVGLFSYFTPTEYMTQAERDHGVFSVNFDLYFDEQMGSFVILKGGDPDTYSTRTNLDSANYLMGLKTLDGDFLNWEPCVSWEIKPGRTSGGVRNGMASMPNDQFKVEDVSVIPGRTKNSLLMLLRCGRGGNEPPNRQDVLMVHSEFTFVDSNLIKGGSSDVLPVGFGGKFHERYLFCSSPVNRSISGMQTKGVQENTGFSDLVLHDLTACGYRGQNLFTAKREEYLRKSSLKGYAVSAPVANLTEVKPYQFNTSRFILPHTSWGFEPNKNANSYTVWEEDADGELFNWCKAPSSGDYVYGTMSGSSGLLSAWDRSSSSIYGHYKIKFNFKLRDFSSAPSSGDIKIAEIGDYTLRMTYGGTLEVYDSAGTTKLGTVFSEQDETKGYQVLLHYGRSMVSLNEDRLMMWWRELGSDTWTPSSQELTDTGDFPIGNGEISFGFMDSNGYGGVEVGIGDIQISTEPLYEPVFTSTRLRQPDGDIEGTTRGHVSAFDDVDWMEVYSDTVELADGSTVLFSGGGSPSVDGDEFVYGPTRGVNYIGNIVNGMANSIFDFTDRFDTNKGYEEIVFENSNMEFFDCLSMINLTGCYGFDLITGNYDGTSWSNTDVSSYTFPSVELTHTGFTQGTGMTIEESFEEGALKGYSILVHNPDTNTWDAQYLIKESFDSVIVLDRSPSVPSGYKIYLMASAASFDVPERMTTSAHTHMGIRFKSPGSAARRSIGEVVFGRWIDWSDCIVESESEMFSNFGLVESDFGFLMPELSYQGSVATHITLTADNLPPESEEYGRLFYSVNSMFELEKPFPLVIAHTDGIETRYVSVEGGFSSDPDGIYKEIEVPLIDHDWTVGKSPTKKAKTPVIESISVDKTTILPGTQLTFSVIATDPQGDTLSYEWDFGEGTQSGSSTNDAISHTYNDLGTYTVQCKATNTAGYTDIRSMTVFVEESGIVGYTLSYPSLVNTLDQVKVTVTGVDAQGGTVTYDNSMPITADTGEYNHFDVRGYDADGEYNPEWIFTKSMITGEVAFILTPRYNGEYEIDFVDRVGRTETATITVSEPAGFPSATITPTTLLDINDPIKGMTLTSREENGVETLFLAFTDGESVKRMDLDGTVVTTGEFWGYDNSGWPILELDSVTVDPDNSGQDLSPEALVYYLDEDGTIGASDASGEGHFAVPVANYGLGDGQFAVWNKNGLPQRGSTLGDEELFVIDDTVIRKFEPTSDGSWLEEITTGQWPIDVDSGFSAYCITVSETGEVFFADGMDRVWEVDRETGATTLLGTVSGTITTIVVDRAAHAVYVGDDTGVITSFDTTKSYTYSASGTPNWSVDPFTVSMVPSKLAVDKHGDVYVGTYDLVAGGGSDSVVFARLSKADGSTVWNSDGAIGVDSFGGFEQVNAIEVDPDGDIYLALGQFTGHIVKVTQA